MRKISADELKTILDAHKKWRLKREGGARADLAGANLADANLAEPTEEVPDVAG